MSVFEKVSIFTIIIMCIFYFRTIYKNKIKSIEWENLVISNRILLMDVISAIDIKNLSNDEKDRIKDILLRYTELNKTSEGK